MSSLELSHEVETLLYREAYYLDTRQWQDWLGLFTDDAEFWAPAWVSEEELASDPKTQLSLIYGGDRGALDDRVFRIEGRDSRASNPLPRSCHVIGNVLVLDDTGREIHVAASWTVHQYVADKGPRCHGGRYEYRLRREGKQTDGDLRIAAKKIVFLNDRIDVPLDIYNI